MCSKIGPSQTRPRRRLVAQSTDQPPFRDARPSMSSETVQVRDSNKLSKSLSKVGIDAPSINTRPIVCL